MNKLVQAVIGEYMKVRRSKVLPLTIAAMCLAPIFGAVFVVVLRDPSLAAGNEGLRAKAALTGFSADWPSFFNLIGQAIGVGGVIVFGFVTSWVFGREYTDRTVRDLLSLPIPRSTIVIAKLIIVSLWCFLIVAAVTLVALGLGGLLSLDGWDPALMIRQLSRVLIITLLALALCPPVAYIASVGRGYLGAIGFVILTVVLAQILGALGLGVYVPWAVPALFSGMGAEAGGPPTLVSYIILLLLSGAATYATVLSWTYADQKA